MQMLTRHSLDFLLPAGDGTSQDSGARDSAGDAVDAATERPVSAAQNAYCAAHSGGTQPSSGVPATRDSSSADRLGRSSKGGCHEAPASDAGGLEEPGSAADSSAAEGRRWVATSNRWEQLCLLLLLVPRDAWQPIVNPQVQYARHFAKARFTCIQTVKALQHTVYPRAEPKHLKTLKLVANALCTRQCVGL